MLSVVTTPALGAEALTLDCGAEAERLQAFLRHIVGRRLNRRGVVLGVSGGVDSAVCAALAVAAFGPDRVFAVLMPEKESGDGGLNRAKRLCQRLGIQPMVEDITATLDAAGCYDRRDHAIREMFPAYGPAWRQKIVISGQGRLPYFTLVVESPTGERAAKRMPLEVYLQVVAATNFKQRVRKMTEYFHADRLNYAVIGTPNRLEYELGFFVRGGDGLADVKPIAHLYKTQVYALGARLGVTDEILNQPPSTDTYTLPQSQEEFFFALPYDQADVLLHAMHTGLQPTEAAARLGIAPDLVAQVWKDFAGKRRMANRTLMDAVTLGKAEH